MVVVVIVVIFVAAIIPVLDAVITVVTFVVIFVLVVGSSLLSSSRGSWGPLDPASRIPRYFPVFPHSYPTSCSEAC